MISVKDQLRKSLLEVCTPEDLQQWFDPLALRLEKTAHAVTLVVVLPHALFGEWFARKGQDVFESTVALLAARMPAPEGENEPAPALSIRYEAPEHGPEYAAVESAPQTAAVRNARKTGKEVPGSEPGFDEFVTNAKHRNTLHVLRDLLPANPRAVCPVVLSGPSGSGKTHLLRATALRLFETVGSGILCLNAEEFRETLEKTFREEDAAESAKRDTHPGVAGCKGLLVDNMHRLSCTDAVQHAFSDALDALLDAGRPVLLAGQGVAAQWPLMDSVRSRLSMGVALSLPDPDLDLCLRFTQQRFRQAGMTLDRESLLNLARRFPDMRRIIGALKRLEALKDVLLTPGSSLSPEDVDQLAANPDGTGLTPQMIMQLAAETFGVNAKDILGPKRKPKLVRARQTAMYLCRELLGHSYPTIGQMFGGKDHSTVIHAVRKVKALQAVDSDAHILVTELTKRCRKLV